MPAGDGGYFVPQSIEVRVDLVLRLNAAWLGIEQATKKFSTQLRRMAARDGCRFGHRMAPGYTYKAGEQQYQSRSNDRRLRRRVASKLLPSVPADPAWRGR